MLLTLLDGAGPLYLRLSEALRLAIRDGRLRPGDRLPGTRSLATELGDYIERVVRNFVKQREGNERFAQWAVRADEADLR